jgi:hypothetical protein
MYTFEKNYKTIFNKVNIMKRSFDDYKKVIKNELSKVPTGNYKYEKTDTFDKAKNARKHHAEEAKKHTLDAVKDYPENAQEIKEIFDSRSDSLRKFSELEETYKEIKEIFEKSHTEQRLAQPPINNSAHNEASSSKKREQKFEEKGEGKSDKYYKNNNESPRVDKPSEYEKKLKELNEYAQKHKDALLVEDKGKKLKINQEDIDDALYTLDEHSDKEAEKWVKNKISECQKQGISISKEKILKSAKLHLYTKPTSIELITDELDQTLSKIDFLMMRLLNTENDSSGPIEQSVSGDSSDSSDTDYM